MIPLCRHLLPGGRRCKGPSVNQTPLCRHHQIVKRVTRRPRYGSITLPLVFPEDRAAIQLNAFVLMQALAEARIDVKTSNSLNALLNTARLNLANAPLLDDAADSVRRVILTPEGDEIAPPHQSLEPGEAPTLHHPNCTCPRCAEQFRGAPPEQHHKDCKCGLCEDNTPSNTPNDTPSNTPNDTPSDQAAPATNHDLILPEAERKDLHSPTRPQTEDAPSSAQLHRAKGGPDQPSTNNDLILSEAKNLSFPNQPADPNQTAGPCLKTAKAEKLYADEPLPDPVNKQFSLNDYLSGDDHVKHEAQYAARARAAIDQGIEPPPYEPFDPKKKENAWDKKYREIMEQVEKNKKIGDEIWQRRFAENTKENIPKPTEIPA